MVWISIYLAGAIIAYFMYEHYVQLITRKRKIEYDKKSYYIIMSIYIIGSWLAVYNLAGLINDNDKNV